MIWMEKFLIIQYVLSFPTHLKNWIFIQIIISSRCFLSISKTFTHASNDNAEDRELKQASNVMELYS
jgi:hypothetical protein